MPEAPEVPAPLANLVWHLLRKRAEDRPPSAEAVIGEPAEIRALVRQDLDSEGD